MKRLKRVCMIIVTIALLTTQSGFLVLAASSAGNENVTRAEWLSQLVKTFEMKVEDENYPDNYFNDLDSASEYYYDVLIATQFGVVDVEAGGSVYPDEVLTRAYAAKILNYCLGYQLEEDASYTFSDVNEIEDKESAQVSVNRKWFSLIDGAFQGEKAVTKAEITFMLEDAKAVWNSTNVQEKHL